MASRVTLLCMALGMVLVLSGCARLFTKPPSAEAPKPAQVAPPEPEPVIAFQQAGDNDRLLGYYGYLAMLSQEQLSQEYDRTLRFYHQQSSDFTLMQLVLLHVTPGAPSQDPAHALDMLSSFLKEPRARESEVWPFAILLQSMLEDQREKDAEIQEQADKLKEETRRYKAVKQKLDALIDAERKMLERNKPVRKSHEPSESQSTASGR